MSFTDPKSLSNAELESGNAFAPRFGADGLIFAIAIDAHQGDVLMAAHMNVDALRLTLETGEVHYFSRSRQKLWKKGEQSGEVQRLVELRTDCDQDVLMLRVEMQGRGAACHTGHRSCFYRRVESAAGTYALREAGDEPVFDPDEVYHG